MDPSMLTHEEKEKWIDAKMAAIRKKNELAEIRYKEIEDDKKDATRHSSMVQMQQVKPYVMRTAQKTSKTRKSVPNEATENTGPKINPFFSNKLGQRFTAPPDQARSLFLADPERDYKPNDSSMMKRGRGSSNDNTHGPTYGRASYRTTRLPGPLNGSNYKPRWSGGSTAKVVPSYSQRSTYRGQGRRVHYSQDGHCGTYGRGRGATNQLNQDYFRQANPHFLDTSTSSGYASWKTEQDEYDRKRIARSKTNKGQWSREWDSHKPVIDETNNDIENNGKVSYLQRFNRENSLIQNQDEDNSSEVNNTTEKSDVPCNDQDQYPFGPWRVVRKRNVENSNTNEVENDSSSSKQEDKLSKVSSSGEDKLEEKNPFAQYLVKKPVVRSPTSEENPSNEIDDCLDFSSLSLTQTPVKDADIQLPNESTPITANVIRSTGEADLQSTKLAQKFDINSLSNYFCIKKIADDKDVSHSNVITSNCSEEEVLMVQPAPVQPLTSQENSNVPTAELILIEEHSTASSTISYNLTEDNGSDSILCNESSIENIATVPQISDTCSMTISPLEFSSDAFSQITSADLIDALTDFSSSASVVPTTLSSCSGFDSISDHSDQRFPSADSAYHSTPSEVKSNNETSIDDRITLSLEDTLPLDSSSSMTISTFELSSDESRLSVSRSTITEYEVTDSSIGADNHALLDLKDSVAVDVSSSIISSTFEVSSDDSNILEATEVVQMQAPANAESTQVTVIADDLELLQFTDDATSSVTCSPFEISSDENRVPVLSLVEITTSSDRVDNDNLIDEGGFPTIKDGRSSSEGDSEMSSLYEPADETFSSPSPSDVTFHSSDSSFKTVAETSVNASFIESANSTGDETTDSIPNVDSPERDCSLSLQSPITKKTTIHLMDSTP